MPDNSRDLADAEPFEVLKSADETDGEFVRFVATLHPASDQPDAGPELTHRRWGADNIDQHLHPQQQEIFRVRRGRYRVIVGDTERTLTEGDEITLPRNTPHRHFNPADRPARVVKEDRPARNSEAFFTTLYALAQAGQTGEDGLPSFLQFAVIQDKYPGHAYKAGLPVGLQKALFSAFAPVGRLLGYRADPVLEADVSAEG